MSLCGLGVGGRLGHADYVIHTASKRGIVKEDPSEWRIAVQAFRGNNLTETDANTIRTERPARPSRARAALHPTDRAPANAC